jgi:putative transposase
MGVSRASIDSAILPSPGSRGELAESYVRDVILTFQYRLVPRKIQHRALETLLESQRVLYNAALEERIGAYRRGVSRTYFDQCRALTEWRQSDVDAREVPATLQRATLKRLDEAYNGFYRRFKKGAKAGLPRFRGKGWWDSFGFREYAGITFDGKCLRFKGMPGRLKVHMHRALPQGSRIRCCTFSRDTKGWKVCFAVGVPASPRREGARKVGVDLGITVFAALSDGGFVPSLNAARRAERRIRIFQRSLSRCQYNSNGRRKARLQVARCYAATSRARYDHLHQASARLIRDYDVIAIEKLNVQPLARGILAARVRDASWAKFVSMLRYKAERAGVQIIEVNPTSTSQECSRCGLGVPKPLRERRHECPRCGLSVDRDINAARNILYRAGVGPGLRNVADQCKRAGGNISSATMRTVRHVDEAETRP